MEQIEPILGFEWNSMSGICSGEAEFMAKLLSNPPISNEGGGIFFPFSSSNEGYYHDVSLHDFANVDNNLMGVDFCKESSDFLNLDVSNDSVESDENMSECVFPGNDLNFGEDFVVSNMPELPRGDSTGCPSESKKRFRPSAEVQRNKRSRKLKKTMNNDDDDSNDKEKDNNTKIRLSSHFSLDGSNGSGAHNSNGKTRACRGSATDPQSLYARKRRERINERLRILQNLVPNGTKVDISTMLEEAVKYVKFLQLQIKLLSSDEMWMYAPIAYNGMDIGLDLKISIKP